MNTKVRFQRMGVCAWSGPIARFACEKKGRETIFTFDAVIDSVQIIHLKSIEYEHLLNMIC